MSERSTDNLVNNRKTLENGQTFKCSSIVELHEKQLTICAFEMLFQILYGFDYVFTSVNNT